MIECNDVLVPVGKEARITARLRRRSILKLGFRRKGRTISFFVDGERIGQAATGRDGCAVITFTPHEKKEYRVLATHQGSGTSEGATAEATIFSRSGEREAIVLDIDGTLSTGSALGSAFRRNRSVRALEGAADVTRALALKYDLIILTGRRSFLRRKTKDWLRKNGFPSAPVYFRPRRRLWVRSEKYKARLIAGLKRDWPNIVIGIGDRDSDARAYVANGLKAIILRESGHCPAGAVAVPSWEGVRRILL